MEALDEPDRFEAAPRRRPAIALPAPPRAARVTVIALVAMAVAVVILASAGTSAPSSATVPSATVPSPAGIRYDGGPDEGTRGMIESGRAPSIRYDGGPEEGAASQDTRPAN